MRIGFCCWVWSRVGSLVSSWVWSSWLLLRNARNFPGLKSFPKKKRMTVGHFSLGHWISDEFDHIWVLRWFCFFFFLLSSSLSSSSFPLSSSMNKTQKQIKRHWKAIWRINTLKSASFLVRALFILLLLRFLLLSASFLEESNRNSFSRSGGFWMLPSGSHFWILPRAAFVFAHSVSYCICDPFSDQFHLPRKTTGVNRQFIVFHSVTPFRNNERNHPKRSPLALIRFLTTNQRSVMADKTFQLGATTQQPFELKPDFIGQPSDQQMAITALMLHRDLEKKIVHMEIFERDLRYSLPRKPFFNQTRVVWRAMEGLKPANPRHGGSTWLDSSQHLKESRISDWRRSSNGGETTSSETESTNRITSVQTEQMKDSGNA